MLKKRDKIQNVRYCLVNHVQTISSLHQNPIYPFQSLHFQEQLQITPKKYNKNNRTNIAFQQVKKR